MRSHPAVRHGGYRRSCATSPAYAGEGPGGERSSTATAELACVSGSDQPWKPAAIQSSRTLFRLCSVRAEKIMEDDHR